MLVRFSVKLPDGRLFHFKTEDQADRFAAKHCGERVPFSMGLLPAELRKVIGQ